MIILLLGGLQRSTLKNLGPNPDLVIKPFDKSSGICLMDTPLYISKIEEPLSDATTYKQLNSDPRVLPIVTPYSPEGRHFSQSVWNR